VEPLYTGIADKIRRWKNAEMFTLSGSLITLLIFSLSRFQLPYYTNIIFPLLAIITAQLVTRLITNNNRFFRILQTTVSILIIVLGIALLIFYSPPVNLLLLIFPAFLLLLFIINNSAYVRSGLSTLILALLLNLIFYPDLLKYQSGNEMAFYVNKEQAGIPLSRIGLYIPSGEFYLKAPVTRTDTIPHDHSLCFVSEEELNELKAREISFTILKEFNEYHVTMLSLKFLNPKTRGKTLQKRYLVRL
jgi:hypothetical protein